MGVDVQYRGLPGGTHRLRFADELPRHLMCGLCGMLSLQMFEDKQGHAFCNVCIGQKSQAAAIYCGYENRDVALDELVESYYIFQVIKDQVVFCPNEQEGCPAYSPLCEMETHQALCAENPERITSSNARNFYRSNTSASPLSAERGNTSIYASTDMTPSSRDPVKIRHLGWPRWFSLPFVLCFTCLTFFPRTVIRVCVKPLLHVAFRTIHFVCRTALKLSRSLLKALGPPVDDTLTGDKFRAAEQRSFY